MTSTSERLTGSDYVVRRSGWAYEGLVAAGFSIDSLEFLKELSDFQGGEYYRFSVEFTCVCGTRERGFLDICPVANEYVHNGREIDVARWLEFEGALSAAHLRRDGYDEANIFSIRKQIEERMPL